ncbi:unnamed protein product [Adineta ricciae]|uniref:Agrin-like protein n=1 Tax=Adineta ricciae TaxID=249248 RepID=A0A814HT54_ADIRI|nr:unnamed protein product [Adineta ricciae]
MTTEETQQRRRRLLHILLIILGVVILLATLFLIGVIYKTLKSKAQQDSLALHSNNLTELHSNRSERVCLHGFIECKYNATCTEQNQCHCIFNCADSNGDACRLDQARCLAYYEKNLTCSSMNCSHGAKCVINENGLAGCDCPINCDEYDRTEVPDGLICASDHRTYETSCELQKKACEIQQNLSVLHSGRCQDCTDSSCLLNSQQCNPYVNCLSKYRPICASNLHSYSNECEMQKYACQSHVNLTKLHDKRCYSNEEQQLRKACKTLTCSNGKLCMLENGLGVCRCLFNCSSEKNPICASDGRFYQNLCEMERARCFSDASFVPVDISYCVSICDKIHCPYGRCKHHSNEQIECECKACSQKYSEHEQICGDNGFTYPSQCLLEHDACTQQKDIKPRHMGPCNNCQNVVCPFNGYCRSEQGNHTCLCSTKDSCLTRDQSNPICGSNQELFYSQCEMDVRSCELNTHLYAVSPHYCIQYHDQKKYTFECGYDEVLVDLNLNHYIECDAFERCPINSYCNKQTNRCCIKVITAILPYRACRSDEDCGRNMICSFGLCQCARNDMMPARNKRECVVVPSHVSQNSTCATSPYGCCNDQITVSPTFNRQGCPENCDCHPTGSLRTSCDPQTGSCYCRSGVDGLTCSHCDNEYWNFVRISTHNNTGCIPCGCHPYGSQRRDCSQDTGQCSCHSFTTGLQCDKCIDSTLVLTDHGCVNMNKNPRRRRQRTCNDLTCLFDGICQIRDGYPRCTCDQVICTDEEQRSMSICASNGRTYRSKCDMKRQQCVEQYEIVLMYLGVCHGRDEHQQVEDSGFAEEVSPIVPIDSKRCITDEDCGENMVCLSEFCECAQQKYKRVPGPQCIMLQPAPFERNKNLVNPIRRTSNVLCMRFNPCENHGVCHDESNGGYICLCSFGWTGRHCEKRIIITIPYFKRQSYLEYNSSTFIKSIDITFASEHENGLILYSEEKSSNIYFVIGIQNRAIDIVIRSSRSISKIQLPEKIKLHTYVRLQIRLLYNEIQAKLNDGNLATKLLPFEMTLKKQFFLGGLPESLHFHYKPLELHEGFQGCVHDLFVNGEAILFNNSEHTGQNIHECSINSCQSAQCLQGTHCVPLTNNDPTNYECLDEDYMAIDRCLRKPCDTNQECILVSPNDYICVCLNCSLDHQYAVQFQPISYVKHRPFQPLEETGKFKMELWFLSSKSSGSIAEHINSKKGHMKLYLQQKILLFNVLLGAKNIALSSRSPIELNTWHRCLIEIYGQKITLILDQDLPVVSYELLSSNTLWPRSMTFIGNLPQQYRPKNSHLFEGFQGSIQKMIINNRVFPDIRQNALELFNITEYSDDPYRSHPFLLCDQTDMDNATCIDQLKSSDTSAEFDGASNAVYAYTPQNLQRNDFDLLLKTKYSSGLVFFVGETTVSLFSKYLSLILVNGFLQFETKVDQHSGAILLKSKVRVDDGRWHRITIERVRRRIIMKLDDIYHYQTVSLSKETDFHPNPSLIYIGGYNQLCSYDEQHCQSFHGCLRNVSIDENYFNLVHDQINKQRQLHPCRDLY